ncbi:MAG: DUF302 domain-containing protein [Bacteroidales bacterium]|nr:DUF302 domain-containing protein [Bacteroidales bacterium]
MNYYQSKTVKGDFDQVIEQVTNLLKDEGFGVLTEIDVKQTLKKKLDVDFKPYKILGACNPQFAYEAFKAEDKIGSLLPCNVIVIDQGDEKIEVAIMDAAAMMKMVGNAKLEEISAEVSIKLEKVLSKIN